eukprot:m.254957 g.254957  ORF g.254957 m.254957 type:complete len:353 (-) comp19152_c2_seq5:108-1166(-)
MSPPAKTHRRVTSTAKVLVLCSLWYFASIMTNVFGKRVLKILSCPMTITVCQLCVITLVLPMANDWLAIPKARPLSRRDNIRFIAPVAILKVIASVSSHLSILKVPVSYAHTVKATMPIFTVVLSRLILGQRHTWAVYFTLVPIMSGVIIATVTEISFDVTGMLCALLATSMFSLNSIYSKKVMSVSALHHMWLLFHVSRMSLIMIAPFWYYKEGHDLFFGSMRSKLSFMEEQTVILELIGNGFTNTLQTVAAFTFLSLVQPVSYSVANVGKRVFVILAAMLYFKNPVTSTNLLGVSIAIFGIYLYNRAKMAANTHSKQMQLEQQSAKLSLPLHHAPVTGNTLDTEFSLRTV